MALQDKRYSSVHTKTGSALTKMQNSFNNNEHSGLINFPGEAALIFQIQKMQEELDYLRGLIETNTDKTSMTLGTSSNTALAGDTNIVTIGSNTTISFGDMISTTKKGVTKYTIVMTVTNGGVSKTITHTLA
jgi:hypothetical protein